MLVLITCDPGSGPLLQEATEAAAVAAAFGMEVTVVALEPASAWLSSKDPETGPNALIEYGVERIYGVADETARAPGSSFEWLTATELKKLIAQHNPVLSF